MTMLLKYGTDIQTVKFMENCHCRDCGWPIIFMCCNVDKKPYNEHDWWEYCSNPTCKNHEGESVFQNTLEWVEKH
jgi:hypothetical protein